MIARKWIGHELPPSVLPIERSGLQFVARAIGETDPVYTDAITASRSRLTCSGDLSGI